MRPEKSWRNGLRIYDEADVAGNRTDDSSRGTLPVSSFYLLRRNIKEYPSCISIFVERSEGIYLD